MCEKQDVLPILWDCVCLCGFHGICCVFRANFAQERLMVYHKMKTHVAHFRVNQGGIMTRAGKKNVIKSVSAR